VPLRLQVHNTLTNIQSSRTLLPQIQFNHTIPPVGIFKCPHKNRTPTLEPSEEDEWDTPTRAVVKALTITGHTRNDIEEQTGVPARDQ
jgi:hypothetical protein